MARSAAAAAAGVEPFSSRGCWCVTEGFGAVAGVAGIQRL
jgi:hypothetical protein